MIQRFASVPDGKGHPGVKDGAVAVFGTNQLLQFGRRVAGFTNGNVAIVGQTQAATVELRLELRKTFVHALQRTIDIGSAVGQRIAAPVKELSDHTIRLNHRSLGRVGKKVRATGRRRLARG